jgi:hypothetical protein
MMPQIIMDLQRQLDEAMEADEDPFIRIEDAAELIGMHPDTLRKIIYNGTCPFGIGYAGSKVRNGFSKILKLPFYYWMTGQAGAGITYEKRNEQRK